MIPSYCLSSTRNITSPESFFLRSTLFSTNTHLPKPDLFSVTPHKTPLKSYIPSLRFRTNRFNHPFATTISSFSEGEEENDKIENKNHQENADMETELPGMAQAFHISSRTASAISICIALAALTLPLLMNSLGQGLSLKTKILSYVTLLFGFYMAWNIGANDVANAMGTSVGSGALTLRQAVLTAAILEFSGALLMGKHVTSTMQKGILVADVFQGKDTLLLAGLLSSLAAAGTWLQVHLRNTLFLIQICVALVQNLGSRSFLLLEAKVQKIFSSIFYHVFINSLIIFLRCIILFSRTKIPLQRPPSFAEKKTNLWIALKIDEWVKQKIKNYPPSTL